MDRFGLRGVLLSSAGALAVTFGGLTLSQSCAEPPLVPLYVSGPVCSISRQVADSAFFFAAIGGAFVVIGAWQAGIGRMRIRAEGGGLVIVVGTIVSTLGFSVSNVLPFVSITAAELGFSLGVVGSILLTFGALKLNVQGTGLSDESAPGLLSRKLNWSPSEWTTAGLLISILVVAVVFVGLALTPQSSGNWCGSFGAAPCPGRESLTLESQTLYSPTNMTIDIRNVGSVSVGLVAYYVKDSAGNLYGNTNWSGPTIAPNALMPATITIDGASFAFQSGYYYAISVITARNNQFTFTALA